MSKKQSSISIFYDGECPFCTKYAMYQNIKNSFKSVSLINLRELSQQQSELLQNFKADVNKGVIVIHGDTNNQKFLQGRLAVAFLSQYDNHNWFMKTMHSFFRVPFISNVLYAIVFILRKITLKILGKKIHIQS
jgi:predicted DCC family thiol-disulfide oxidoreductase YuxK